MIRVIAVGIFLFAIVLASSGQENRMDRINQLQGQLDRLKNLSSSSDSSASITEERDSLKVLVELLNLELLVAESKLHKLELDLKECRGDEMPLTGYFVVVESERTEADAKFRIENLKKKYPEYTFKVGQNSRKSWFHIHLVGSYDRAEVGQAVQQVRNAGFENAWWIYLSDN